MLDTPSKGDGIVLLGRFCMNRVSRVEEIQLGSSKLCNLQSSAAFYGLDTFGVHSSVWYPDELHPCLLFFHTTGASSERTLFSQGNFQIMFPAYGEKLAHDLNKFIL